MTAKHLLEAWNFFSLNCKDQIFQSQLPMRHDLDEILFKEYVKNCFGSEIDDSDYHFVTLADLKAAIYDNVANATKKDCALYVIRTGNIQSVIPDNSNIKFEAIIISSPSIIFELLFSKSLLISYYPIGLFHAILEDAKYKDIVDRDGNNGNVGFYFTYGKTLNAFGQAITTVMFKFYYLEGTTIKAGYFDYSQD